MVVLKDRLFNAQYPSQLTTATAPPPFPFQRVDVKAEPLPQVQTQTQVCKNGYSCLFLCYMNIYYMAGSMNRQDEVNPVL